MDSDGIFRIGLGLLVVGIIAWITTKLPATVIAALPLPGVIFSFFIFLPLIFYLVFRGKFNIWFWIGLILTIFAWVPNIMKLVFAPAQAAEAVAGLAKGVGGQMVWTTFVLDTAKVAALPSSGYWFVALIPIIFIIAAVFSEKYNLAWILGAFALVPFLFIFLPSETAFGVDIFGAVGRALVGSSETLVQAGSAAAKTALAFERVVGMFAIMLVTMVALWWIGRKVVK
jgi:hypothetical protein